MNAPMTSKQALPMPTSTKPCPFCNGVANLFRADLYDDGSKVVYWHECCSCGATAGQFASEAEAEAAWNRRATASAGSETPDEDADKLRRIAELWIEYRNALRRGERIVANDLNDDPEWLIALAARLASRSSTSAPPREIADQFCRVSLDHAHVTVEVLADNVVDLTLVQSRPLMFRRADIPMAHAPTSAPVTPDEIAEFRAHFLTADVRLQTLLDRVLAAAQGRAPRAPDEGADAEELREILIDVDRKLEEGAYGVPMDSEAAAALHGVIARARRAIPAPALVRSARSDA